MTAGMPASSGGGKKTIVKILQFKVEIADQLLALADEYMELHPEIDLQIESVNSDNYSTNFLPHRRLNRLQYFFA